MRFIPNEVIAQVLDRCDIVETISRYIPLKNAGRNFKALCPFHHEKTPSFAVNPQKQIFHCFGCGVGGNAITFVMKQERVEFPEAVRLLAQRAGVAIPEDGQGVSKVQQLRQQIYRANELAYKFYHQYLFSDKGPAAKAARDYLQQRQVGPEMAKKFQLGLAPDQWDGLLTSLRRDGIPLDLMEKAGLIIANPKTKGYYDRFRNRIMFPIFDARGECVAFGGRALEKTDGAKYINSPETPVYTKGQQLYGLNLSREAVSRQDEIVVVEGYMDFIMPFQAGVENIVASLGTALTSDQIRLIARYTRNVVMLYDADAAGQSAMLRSLDALIEEGLNVRVAALTREDDPDSFLRKYGVEKFREQLGAADSLFDFKLKHLLAGAETPTVEKRAEISAQMLPTIQKFPSEVVKAEYLKRLATMLNVSLEALALELKKLTSTAPRTGTNRLVAALTAAPAAGIRPVERDLLKLMLDESEFIPVTRQEVELADFQSGSVRRIVERVFTLQQEGQAPTLPALMNSFEDQEIQQVISSLMVAQDPVGGDKQRMLGDCIQRLKQDRLKSRRKTILQQMELARSRGDQRRLDELTHEFNQLIKIKG